MVKRVVKQVLFCGATAGRIFAYYLQNFYLSFSAGKNRLIIFFIVKYKVGENALRLNIGCGSQRLDGYINIDRYSRYSQIKTSAERLPFKDGSVEEIYASHIIEHLAPSALNDTLNEWCRVLKPGGQIVLRCPNFELYLREWLEGDDAYRQGWGIINVLGFSNRGAGYINRNGFTVMQLRKLMDAKGFRTIRCEVRETRPEYKDTCEYRERGDIIYEGLKEERSRFLYIYFFDKGSWLTKTGAVCDVYEQESQYVVEVLNCRRICKKYGKFLMNRKLFNIVRRFRPDIIGLGQDVPVKDKIVERIKKIGRCEIVRIGANAQAGFVEWELSRE